MSRNASDDADESRSEPRDEPSRGRYSAIDIDGKALLIYDEANEDAWIQSDTWTTR